MLELPDQSRLLVVILAAGESRRLGQPKQLVGIDGEPILRRQCRMALEAWLGPVAVILGCRAADCAAAIADLPVEQHVNEHWANGLGTSIRLASSAAITAGADGLLLLHADQYRVTPTDLRALAAAWLESGRLSACISVSGSESGPPVIFPQACFANLLTLDGDQGARRVLAELPDGAVQRVTIPNAFVDLDLPADLASLARAHCAAERVPWSDEPETLDPAGRGRAAVAYPKR
jgi:molybdenum cofactor cytidylyltransferase